MQNKKPKKKELKALAINYQGLLVTTDLKVFDSTYLSSTSACQRHLKEKTGKNFDIIPIDYNGDFTVDAHLLPKVTKLLTVIGGSTI